ncbi:MAG: hypothetical protein ACOX0H_01455 [Patescibacteria group bacterium]|jgi:hypothetical protein
MKNFLILSLIIIFAGLSSCRNSNFQTDNSCTEEIMIARLEVENNYLKAEVAKLQMELNECKSNFTVVPVAKTTTRPKTTTKAAAPKPAAATPPRNPVPQSKIETTPPRVGVAKLDYLRQDGEIIFCVSANSMEDRYFPHFAIERGVTFIGIADNEVRGYNWKVEPTEFMEGDYGVTMDGTFYVSHELLKATMKAAGENLNSVDIKCPYTGWIKKPMTLDTDSGYWIFYTKR